MDYKVVDNDTWINKNGDVIIRTYVGRRYSTPRFTLTKASGEVTKYRSLKGAKGEVWGEEVK